MLELKFGAEKQIQAAAFYLRYQVFVLEQEIDPQDEFDALDDDWRHYFVLFDGKRPIATLRYQALDEHTLQPDRFCVAKAFRNCGNGRRLLQACEKQGIKDGFTQSQLSAELSAKTFYQKAGYQVVSEPFYEDGISCVKMAKKLPKD